MKFVIIAQPRSGTSMLVNTLNSIDGFNVYGELFVNTSSMKKIHELPHPQKIQQQMIEKFVKNSYDNSGKTIVQFLDDIYKTDNTGFKLLLPHLKRHRGIRKYLRDNDIFKIVLYRENKLNQVISSRTNRKKGKVTVNVIDIVNSIERLIKRDKELDAFCYGKFVKKTYEQLTNDDDITKIDLSWMGLGEVNVPLRKYKSKKLEDRIENYDELVKFISKTKFKKWL